MKKRYILWLKAAAIHVVKAMAQTAIAAIGSSAMLGSIHWVTVLSTSLLAGLLSLLASVKGLPEIKEPETNE